MQVTVKLKGDPKDSNHVLDYEEHHTVSEVKKLLESKLKLGAGAVENQEWIFNGTVMKNVDVMSDFDFKDTSVIQVKINSHDQVSKFQHQENTSSASVEVADHATSNIDPKNNATGKYATNLLNSWLGSIASVSSAISQTSVVNAIMQTSNTQKKSEDDALCPQDTGSSNEKTNIEEVELNPKSSEHSTNASVDNQDNTNNDEEEDTSDVSRLSSLNFWSLTSRSPSAQLIIDAVSGAANASKNFASAATTAATAATTAATSAALAAFDSASMVMNQGFDSVRLSAEQFIEFMRHRLSEPQDLQELRALLQQHDLGEYAELLYAEPHNFTVEKMINVISMNQISAAAEAAKWTHVQRTSFYRACRKQRSSPVYFGLDIKDCMHRTTVAGYGRPLPTILVEFARIINSMEEGYGTQGIFRISPNFQWVETVEAAAEANDFTLLSHECNANSTQAVHAVASSLKKYLRSLPVRLLEPLPRDEVAHACQLPPKEATVAARAAIAKHLDEDAVAVTSWLMDVLREIVKAQSKSLEPTQSLDGRGLSIIFAMTLFPDVNLVDLTLELGIGGVHQYMRDLNDQNVAFLTALINFSEDIVPQDENSVRKSV